jgi:hypothetical protein
MAVLLGVIEDVDPDCLRYSALLALPCRLVPLDWL